LTAGNSTIAGIRSTWENRGERNVSVKLPRVLAAVAGATGLLMVLEAPVIAQNAPVGDPAAPSSAHHEVNITRDSAPGWLPSSTQEQQVLKGTSDYFSELDQEQYERAYAMMAEINRRSLPLAQFIQENHKFHERSGPLVRRSILKITWTKDPASAPFPGVYAAIDIATRFANVDRHCGYVVLYQPPSGGDFQVMRQEANFIDNATAQTIERQQSRAVLDSQWAALAANCPNYNSKTSAGSVP
jgi:hypothetical protein